MKGEIKNLVKNVLEENIVKFQDQTSNVLYSKLTNRLKQEYVNVSKRVFKNFNEAYSPDPSANTVVVGPPIGSEDTPKKQNPDITYGVPPEAKDPGPAPKKPVKGKDETDEEFKKRIDQWYEDIAEWQQQYKAWKKYQAWLEGSGRKPNRPGYKPSRK
jgi:septin family protein